MDIKKSQSVRFMPKYARVMADMVRRIGQGQWKVGRQIPSLACLETQYPFHRLTILAALHHLAREGYLNIEQGRGTTVVRRRIEPVVGILFGDAYFGPNVSPFCALLAKAALDFFHRRGFEVKFYLEHAHLLAQGIPNRDLVRDIEKEALAGLITAESNAPVAFAETSFWKFRQLPYVDISLHEIAKHRVTADYEAMIRIGLDFVRQSGRRSVGAIGLHYEPGNQVEYFEAQAEARSLKTLSAWLPLISPTTEQGGFQAMHAIWQNSEKPEALIITDDILGKGAMQAMLGLGIRVPESLLVVCHTNKGSGVFHPIAVPRLEYDARKFMAQAGGLLLKLMENPQLPAVTIRVPPVLRSVTRSAFARPVGKEARKGRQRATA